MTPIDFKGLVVLFLNVINYAIGFLVAVLFVYFIWKLIDTWVLHGGDEQKRAEGRTVALSMVLVMVLIISVWGIVTILRESFFKL